VTVGSAAQVPNLTPAQQQILNEIAYEEQSHVRFLRSALGASAVAMPSIDLSFFGPLAVAAGITTVATGTGAFNPFSSFDYFLVGAFIFEDVGVTAYSGAAGLLTDKTVNLPAAAGILAVEAYHAGYIRTSLTGRAIAAAAGGTTYPYLAAGNRLGRDRPCPSDERHDSQRDRCGGSHPCRRFRPEREPGPPHRLRQRHGRRKERRLLPQRDEQHLRYHHCITGRITSSTSERTGHIPWQIKRHNCWTRSY
jgi:hypothetical protein